MSEKNVGMKVDLVEGVGGGQGAHSSGLQPMTCRYFKVAHRDMVFLKFILEAYEGMNVMSTVDNKAGIIRIAIMPGFVDDLDGLLAELGRQVAMEPAEWHDEQCTF
jgi:hypothetical protein